MDVKSLSEAAIAVIPDDTTGLLIMKVSGTLSPEENNRISKEMGQVVRQAGLRCTLIVFSGRVGEFEFTLQHLTDEALRDIGFQRIYSEFTESDDP